MLPMDELADLAKPGWIPLVILVVMFVAVFFLWRSMRRMLRTIDPDLPHEADLDAEEQTIEGEPQGAPAGKVAGLLRPREDAAASPVSPDVR